MTARKLKPYMVFERHGGSDNAAEYLREGPVPPKPVPRGLYRLRRPTRKALLWLAEKLKSNPDYPHVEW